MNDLLEDDEEVSDIYNNRLLPLTVGPCTFITANRQTRKDISYRPAVAQIFLTAQPSPFGGRGRW